ncbi:hypothetical protein D0T84_16895 [Dysgonomonas sp. 521]|uniref:hypothetical protein n=1 Tax=Dysgonomonas sp. 521 TaxID=2302932 RepID=UPI0013D3AA61|nr:hypothetical protein [Dysgonomonas sp. 521]NDV96579.1 hypothetical protein [Dysgonomonas sp. 521]
MMKQFFIFFSLLFLLFSNNGMLRAQQDAKQLLSDTTIVYFVDGVSAEGTEAIVKYMNGKITESLMEIYGETGRAIIKYTFTENKIAVNEKYYKYKVYFSEIESGDDIALESEKDYCLDMDGNIMGAQVEDRIDVFNEFKEAVPFRLEE